MAKNKKQPNVQLLSPENYIRQKARNLPVYECYINSDWQKMKSVEIVISRIHANGNLTAGAYMVDLLCLGVKDTLYLFNAPKEEYEDMLETLSENLDMIKTDYVLVHNIIFAANEFAAELGFKPHKDFTSITQYLLEEDTDDIELIEIECGHKGRPLFVKTENTPEAQASRIIKQLEKSAGAGNFDVIYGEDIDEMDFDDEPDEGWGLEDEYNLMTYEEKINLFRELSVNGLEDINDDDKQRIVALADSIYYMDICMDDKVDDFCNRWAVESEMTIDKEPYTAELLSQEPGRTITEEEEFELDELDMLMNDKSRKVEKCLNELKKKWGDIAYLNYRELKYLELHKPKEYEKKIEDYCTRFSSFPLFKLEKFRHTIIKSTKTDKVNLIPFEVIFEGRSSITESEMFEFQMTKLLLLITRGKINELEAMYNVLDDLNLSEDYYSYLKTMLILIRLNLLQKYLEKK